MIGVSLQPEPEEFDSNVRIKGNKYGTSALNSKFKPFWKSIACNLHDAYRGVCAYTSMYVLSPGSVDHFLPKSRYPALVYEWHNYRLASSRVNQHKGDSEEIIDPFIVQNEWFEIDFPSCLIKANDSLSDELKGKINKTIKALKLNDDDSFVQERCDMMVEYVNSNVTIDFLYRRYPFLAKEIVRQNIELTAVEIFKKFP